MTNIIKYEQQKQQLEYLKSLAKIAADSKQYANMTEGAMLNLMLSARDLGISPLKALNGGFYVVNGKVCMSTAMMADRIRKAGHSIKIVEMSKDKCVIIAIRKDNGDSIKYEYTWDDATIAGLTGSMTWKKFPKLMLYNRCMSTVARILFSDVLGACYSEEERHDIEGTKPENRPLENPEDDILVQGNTLEADENTGEVKQLDCLTEEQAAQLDVLIQEIDDAEHIQKLVKHIDAEMTSIYQIKAKDFDRVIRNLEKKRGANDKTRVA